jgi:hypothetical protein
MAVLYAKEIVQSMAIKTICSHFFTTARFFMQKYALTLEGRGDS